MSQGFISLHRKLMDNPLWSDSNYLKLWVYCLFEASHKDHEQLVGNQMVKLKRGQFVKGRFALADDMNKGVKPKQRLNDKTWWRYLENLEKWQMLTIKSTNKFSVITIDKYDFYQSISNKQDQQKSNDCPSNDQQMSTNNNGNNVNKENIYTIFEYWKEKKIIVHKSLNKKMESHINARLEEHEISELLKAIDNYDEVLNSDKYFWTHRWTLQDFMKPNNVIRFMDSSKPLETFLANKSNKPKQTDFDDYINSL